jgi:hypothetical protein
MHVVDGHALIKTVFSGIELPAFVKKSMVGFFRFLLMLLLLHFSGYASDPVAASTTL